MRATEFRLIREGLGLTGGWLSSHLEVNPRTIDRWEAGDTAIPEFAARALRDLEQRARDEVAARVDALERWGVQEVSIHETPGSMPARWQRAVAFRVRQEVGDVLIHRSSTAFAPRSRGCPDAGVRFRVCPARGD